MDRQTRYPVEVRERAVRLVFEHQDEHDSRVGGHHLGRLQVGHDPRDSMEVGEKGRERRRPGPGLTTSEHERPKELEKENKELRRVNGILLKAAAAFFGSMTP